jgi:asparagine synthase (glutamine-hydrolysing)
MRFFACIIDPVGNGISDSMLHAYESLPRSRRLMFEWRSFPQVSLLTVGDCLGGEPLAATTEGGMAAGMVRLDNRAEVSRWAECYGQQLSDLDLVLRLVLRHGTRNIPQLLGDFAFIVWEPSRRTAIAACDPFRIKKLYYARPGGFLAFASRAEALALEDKYEVQFLAEWVAGGPASPGLSVYSGVSSMPGGTIAEFAQGRLTTTPFWSPDEVAAKPGATESEHEAAELLRSLLIEAVKVRLSGKADTWSQLSGGLDSSSVVSIAEWLARHGEVPQGLAGTVTYVDRQGTAADERQYSDVITGHWRVRNETIVDPPLWYDQRYPLPHLDEPRIDFMLYPRELQLCDVVSASAGHVLLTGQGSDEFLSGNMFFFADWIARGRFGAAVREMVRRSSIGRVSFWDLAYRNAITPLMPAPIRRRFGPEVTHVPPWMTPAVVRRFGLRDRAIEMTLYAGPIGNKYRHAVVRSLDTVSRTIGYAVLEDKLDVRHPFLYRPLVEFALTLPPDLVVRPYARKWVLREAVRGIVPEAVRTRIGKGSANERYAWSLTAQRQLFEPLIQQSMLADLGVVSAARLRAAFDRAPRQPGRIDDPHSALQGVLAIEAWLQMRAGRWPRGGHQVVQSVAIDSPQQRAT